MQPTTRTLMLPALLAGLVLAAACGEEHGDRTPAELEPVRVHIGTVESLVTSRIVEVRGLVQPTRQSFVSSRVTGPVVAVHVEAGDVAREDQPLLDIQPEAIQGQVGQAAGAKAQAQAALALAERNYERYKALHEEKAASELELDMARMQYEQAKGAVRQAEGAVQAADAVAAEAVVKAPFPARVIETLVEVGDLAAPGRPLVRVESLQGRQIWLTVREADIGFFDDGDPIEVVLDTRPDLGVVQGTVDEIVPAADPATHTFLVKVGLGEVVVPSGLAGRGRVATEEVEMILVPASAVHRRGGLELVVVRAEDGTSRTRAITTGRTLDEDRIEVLSGLEPGDSVAVDIPGPVVDGTPLEVAS